jgi:hypothetical protein
MVHNTTGTAMTTATRMMIRCSTGVYSRTSSSYARITFRLVRSNLGRERFDYTPPFFSFSAIRGAK